jgi:hypothetical protein
MSEEVTAGATVVLVVVTAIYAWLTLRMAKAAEASSQAAKEAAEHSRVAAEASTRSALVAESNVNVKFRIDRADTANHPAQIAVRNVGSTSVYVHRIEALSMYLGGVVPRHLRPATLDCVGDLPSGIPPEHAVLCTHPERSMPGAYVQQATLDVYWSLDGSDDRLQHRRVSGKPELVI